MMRPKTSCLVLAALTLGLAAERVVAQETDWKKLMDEASTAYQQADYSRAEKLFIASVKEAEKFGEEDPRLATSLNNLASLYQRQGKYAEAESLYKRSLAIYEKSLGPEHSNVAMSFNNLAALYQVMGKDAEAELLYKRAIAISEMTLAPEHPDFVSVFENYATLLRKMKRDAEAEKMEASTQAGRDILAFKKALELRPDDERTCFALGDVYLQEGYYDNAIVSYKRGLEIVPEDIGARSQLCLAYFGNTQYDEALVECRLALEIRPDYADALKNMGRVYMGKGQYDAALHSYEKLVDVAPGIPMNHWWLARSFMWKGNYERAKEELHEALRLDPNFESAYHELGMNYFIEGKFLEADEAFRKFEAATPPYVYGILWHSLSLHHIKGVEDAMDYLERHAKVFEDDDWHLALLHYYEGKLKEEELLLYAGDEQRQSEAYFYIGCQYFLHGNKRKARECFRKTLDTKLFHHYEYAAARARMEQLDSR